MRVPLIAGNWKMNKTVGEAVDFVNAVQGKLPDDQTVETAIAGESMFLSSMINANHDHVLKIGAENCYFEDAGAFTGETSPKALADLGVDYTIVGHSERRQYFNETDDMINRKVLAVYRNGMVPIVCCDETMGRRASGEAIHWVVSQVTGALKGVTPEQADHLVIAYEPSWAIGSGHSASSDQAEEGCYLIRQTLADIYSDEIANNTRVLYGGSVTPANVDELMGKQDIDGVLAGGASLDAETFLQLAHFNQA